MWRWDFQYTGKRGQIKRVFLFFYLKLYKLKFMKDKNLWHVIFFGRNIIRFTSWFFTTDVILTSVYSSLVESGYVLKHSSLKSRKDFLRLYPFNLKRRLLIQISFITNLWTYPELVDDSLSRFFELYSDLYDVSVMISLHHVTGLPGVSAHLTQLIIRDETSALIVIFVTRSDVALPE